MTRLLTQAEFARHVGCHPSHVSRLKAAGRLVMVGHLVDVEASEKLIEETRSREDVAERHALARGDDDAVADPAASLGIQRAREIKERYLALEAKRAYEEACGRLLVKDEVTATVAGMATSFRVAMEALPMALASRIVALGADEAAIEALLSREIERALSDLSDSFATIGRGTADGELG